MEITLTIEAFSWALQRRLCSVAYKPGRVLCMLDEISIDYLAPPFVMPVKSIDTTIDMIWRGQATGNGYRTGINSVHSRT